MFFGVCGFNVKFVSFDYICYLGFLDICWILGFVYEKFWLVLFIYIMRKGKRIYRD